VAVGEADLLMILRWLDPAKNPEILIECAETQPERIV
jgi:hypothetical protein